MASIVTAILKATVGKLLDKGRKMVADRLEEGDVTDEQFRTMIVGEIDEIKSKLDGIARANLLASIRFLQGRPSPGGGTTIYGLYRYVPL